MTMKSINVAVAVIINDKGEVLLTQRYEPKNPSVHLSWQLPGGGVEKNESIEDACIREALEETGFKIKLLSPKPHLIVSRYERRDYLLNGFKAKAISGTINTELDQETADARWFKIEDIKHLRTLKDTDTMVEACNI